MRSRWTCLDRTNYKRPLASSPVIGYQSPVTSHWVLHYSAQRSVSTMRALVRTQSLVRRNSSQPEHAAHDSHSALVRSSRVESRRCRALSLSLAQAIALVHSTPRTSSLQCSQLKVGVDTLWHCQAASQCYDSALLCSVRATSDSSAFGPIRKDTLPLALWCPLCSREQNTRPYLTPAQLDWSAVLVLVLVSSLAALDCQERLYRRKRWSSSTRRG